jgi:Xaa-Pro aminopeptidase
VTGGLVVPVTRIQEALRGARLDGWLLYDFRGSNPVARQLLSMAGAHTSRRFFVWIGAQGPVRILHHAIEPGPLAHLAGERIAYARWQSLDEGLATLLRGASRIAMEYVPGGVTPYASYVDGGTLERVRSVGVEVVSSADLIQALTCAWSDAQREWHGRAVEGVQTARDAGLAAIRPGVREVEAQAVIGQALAASGLVTEHGANVSFGPNAANPHYEPTPGADRALDGPQIVLFDIVGKVDHPLAPFADITWMSWHGGAPPDEVARIWTAVSSARDVAVRTVQSGWRERGGLAAWEVDRAAQDHLVAAGLGEYLLHRTGHSLGHDHVHGQGAHLDDFETRDLRRLVPRTAFTIEPGIYLPGRFGVRSEINVFLADDGPEITTDVQEELTLV